MPEIDIAILLFLSKGLFAGLLVGFFLASFGGGGSVLATPLIIHFVGVADAHLALGTSAAAVALTALINIVRQLKTGLIRWGCAFVFSVFGVWTAGASALYAQSIAGPYLVLGFSALMLFVAFFMLYQGPESAQELPCFHWRPLVKLVLTSLGVGVLSGLFGIGGGFLVVPGLMMSTGMAMSQAVATSLVVVAAFGITTTIPYTLASNVDWLLALIMMAGGFIGGIPGFYMARQLDNHKVLARRFFAGLIIIIALYTAYQAVILS